MARKAKQMQQLAVSEPPIPEKGAFGPPPGDPNHFAAIARRRGDGEPARPAHPPAFRRDYFD